MGSERVWRRNQRRFGRIIQCCGVTKLVAGMERQAGWRALGELKPVTPNSERVENLVSAADTLTHKSLLHWQLEMEPVVGFEPTTDGLQNRCSTTELNWQNHVKYRLYKN